MGKQEYINTDIQIRAIRKALHESSDMAERTALRLLIIDLEKKYQPGYIGKSALAKMYGLDLRTFTKKLWETECIGKITDSPDAKREYNKMKNFSPKQLSIIYETIGPPNINR